MIFQQQQQQQESPQQQSRRIPITTVPSGDMATSPAKQAGFPLARDISVFEAMLSGTIFILQINLNGLDCVIILDIYTYNSYIVCFATAVMW